MGNILVGSIPGVIVGERLARSVPAAGLRPALGCAMLASALGVASKAGLDLPAVAIVGPPLLIGVFAYALSRRAHGRDRPRAGSVAPAGAASPPR
jgi:uncharacterized protein